MTKEIRIQIASDFVCPWCLVGHVRLERALRDAGLEAQAKIEWLPFELNPGMPEEGADRREYMIKKFGSAQRLEELQAHMKEVGKGDGIEFRQDLIKRSPNTFKAHRLTWHVSQNQPEKTDALVRRIFMAYFTEGKDIGDTKTLAKIAAEVGVNEAETFAFLGTKEGFDEVRALEEDVRARGVTMVPNFLIGGEEIRGAILSEDMQEFLKAA